MIQQRAQGGFTLIELVIVIVILGILAAVAVPRYLDLTNEAEQAAVNGVAGSLASASAINYAASKAGSSTAVQVTVCTDVAGTLQGGLPSTDYVITAATGTPTPPALDCVLTLGTGTGATSATFQAIATN